MLTGPLTGIDEAERLADELLEALRPQAHLGGIALDVRATVGIAVHPRDGDDAELLLVRAAMALHAGKQDGRPVLVYDHASDDHTPERLALAGELRHAIEAGELLLSYQPKLDLRTGAITGVEALVRWRHPQRGVLMPDQFIELAERTGLVRPLTHWTLEEAADQQMRWSAQGVDLTIAVNISARALTPDLPGAVAALVTSHPGARLEIELTETLMIEGTSVAMDVVDALAATGVRLAVDDFGTGYASLAYLKRLPVRELKIDRGFVTEMDDRRGDRAIVRATVDLGRGSAWTWWPRASSPRPCSRTCARWAATSRRASRWGARWTPTPSSRGPPPCARGRRPEPARGAVPPRRGQAATPAAASSRASASRRRRPRVASRHTSQGGPPTIATTRPSAMNGSTMGTANTTVSAMNGSSPGRIAASGPVSRTVPPPACIAPV